jgi:hypothetical protein
VLDCGFQELEGAGREVMIFSSDPQDLQLLIVREPDDGPGPGGLSANYDLRAFAIALEGRLSCVDAPEQLWYQSSLHNWADYLEAQVDGRRFLVDILFQPIDSEKPWDSPWVWSYTLNAFEASGEKFLGPVDLACETLEGVKCKE